MNRKLLAGITILSGALLFAGCTAATNASGDTSTATAADLTPTAVMAENADYTTVNTDEWDTADSIAVDLAKPAGTGVKVSGSTITITAAGVYRLSGSLAGQVVVAAPDDAQVVLILDGAVITNTGGSVIDVQSADDVAIHLADDSVNAVSDAASYAEDATANAAIYSAADLTISGGGSLTVHGNGNDGITSKDDLVILDGDITVTAAADALRGKDSLVVEGGTLDLTATTGDGLYSKGDQSKDAADIDWTRGYIYVSGGTIDITAGDDGIQAFTDTVIAGGTVNVAAADDGIKGEAIVSIGVLDDAEADASEPAVTVSKSNEGIEAASIGISAGKIKVTASDDGMNASGMADLQALMAGESAADAAEAEAETAPATETEAEAKTETAPETAPGGGGGEFQDSGEVLNISGGKVTVNAEGDGLDSNGSLTITGGTTTVYGPTRGGNGSLDANGDMTVDGGTVWAFGPGDMEQTPSAGDQDWVVIKATLAAGATGTIVDASGTEVGKFTSLKAAASVILSNNKIVEGETYSVMVDGESIGDAVAGEGGMGGPGGGGMGGQGGPGGDNAGGPGGTPPTDGERPALPDGMSPDDMPEPPEGFDGERPEGAPERPNDEQAGSTNIADVVQS
ncbi:carbohydrate-binding domain-containing protein [Leucobacter sp. cx-328]|uniref:carbohydrate-binding domain-containing protein n=1 Tax=unclassified Leucobacter TaxID=2621730 RepID=UPI00165DA9DA|nr:MULTISPECIES: carbohydrate-binding domain-containing protein [unclassified Leucobacter]MBC9945115.1 carbohydrate-binding domain-containing protein [Leucobacter sp. cx-328]